jgi:hypothetical protein
MVRSSQSHSTARLSIAPHSTCCSHARKFEWVDIRWNQGAVVGFQLFIELSPWRDEAMRCLACLLDVISIWAPESSGRCQDNFFGVRCAWQADLCSGCFRTSRAAEAVPFLLLA